MESFLEIIRQAMIGRIRDNGKVVEDIIFDGFCDCFRIKYEGVTYAQKMDDIICVNQCLFVKQDK